jgi:phosphate starvation-inducible PhoH-like protein
LDNVIERTVMFDTIEHIINLFGNCDENIKVIEDAFNVKVVSRDNGIRIIGHLNETEKAETVIKRLIDFVSQGEAVTKQSVSYLVQLAGEDQLDKVKDFPLDVICMTARGKQIKSKTYGQKRYVSAINQNAIVFGIGPAGTGKTFLAC